MTIAQRLLNNWVDNKTIEYLGISSIQMGVLFHLMKKDGCFLTDLSKELRQNKSAITTLVERMMKKGLVEKKIFEKDRRAAQLFITPSGEKTAEKALEYVSEFNKMFIKDLTESDLEVIHRFIDGIIRNFS